MKSVMIKNTCIGEGMPKICLPIVGKTIEEICSQASRFADFHCDIAEWRIDWFEDCFDLEAVRSAGIRLREVLSDTPILLTFRTAEEGGERSITDEQYIQLNAFACEHKLADAIDVELFRGDEIVRQIIEQAHKHQTCVVVSNHNFTMTPDAEEIVSRLQLAEVFGGDILKIAVMPQSPADVITLLTATEEAHRLCGKPLITMSMGSLGAVSRVCGEVFGSAVTFGAAGAASAPGQLAADDLFDILKALHAE